MKDENVVSSIFPEDHGLGPFRIKHCGKAISIPGRRWNKMDEFGHNTPSHDEILSLVSTHIIECEINAGTLFGGEGFFHENNT